MSPTKLFASLLIVLELCHSSCVAAESGGDGVDHESNNNRGCLTRHPSPKRLTNGTHLKFCSGRNISLENKLNFTRLHNISISSSNGTDRAMIECKYRNAGFIFTECYNISITNITITGCGLQYLPALEHRSQRNGKQLVFQSSIFIINSKHAHFGNVHVTNSNGTGLILINTIGRVNIQRCTFENNILDLTRSEPLGEVHYAGGGGVYIELTQTSTTNQEHRQFENETDMTTYKLERVVFKNNLANVSDRKTQTPRVQRLGNGMGRGGGLSIAIKSASANFVIIKVTETNLLNNSAVSAGGLNVFYQGPTSNNTVDIVNSSFRENKCFVRFKGGGGAYTGYLFKKEKIPRGNKISFSNCQFIGNEATFGGGTALYSSRSTSRNLEETNSMSFTNCTWQYNKAKYGSAVTVLPQTEHVFKSGFVPIPSFDNCTFVSNYVEETVKSISPHYTYVSRGRGAFLVSTFTVEFKRQTTFSKNNGSAMYLTQGIVKFLQGSRVKFSNNTGFQGGAIALYGFSALYFRDDCNITFENNTAISRGGAIYLLSFDKQNYLFSQSCFLQYEGDHYNDTKRRNLSFEFRGNRAMTSGELPIFYQKMNFGHSIYATTLLPCQNNCSRNSYRNNEASSCLKSRDDVLKSYHDPFFCIGDFKYNDNRSIFDEVATSGREFCPPANESNATKPVLEVIPGKVKRVPISIKDDLHHNVWTVYRISANHTADQMNGNASQVHVAPLHVYSYENIIKLYGTPHERAEIRMATTSTREIAVSVKVELQACPPGFIVNSTDNMPRCVCSASVTNKTYMGISGCDQTQFRAFLTRGYWVGYFSEGNETDKRLLSGHCPSDYCLHYRSLGYTSTAYMLPSTSSKVELDSFICGPNKTGILCGSCSENYSVLYHSSSYRCGANKHCKWGIVLYIITELLPVSILFAIVVVFHISFTSGALTGVIFYTQMIDSMEVNARNTIFISHPLHIATKVYRFCNRMFNLNYFALAETSYCLWEGAGTLDAMAFKYVTVCYTLLFVIVTVAILRLCKHTSRCQRRTCEFITGCCKHCNRCPYKASIRSSMIHGLSAFFVMCYAQCTRVSFMLLTYGTLRSNSPGDNVVRQVVFYNGDMSYLEGAHLKYALPAMFFTVVIVVIPPVLLIFYPLCQRLFEVLKIKNSKFLQTTRKYFPLHKLEPLLEIFQAPFKERYQFFAGMYFIYRLVALAGFTFSESLTRLFSILEVLLICMLAFISICQPYKQRWHNILDTLLICNLAIVNGLTLYNYKRTFDREDYEYQINTAAALQIVLIFLPLVYIVVYTMVQFLLKVKRYIINKRQSAIVCEEEEEYHWMLMTDNRDTIMHSDSFATSSKN